MIQWILAIWSRSFAFSSSSSYIWKFLVHVLLNPSWRILSITLNMWSESHSVVSNSLRPHGLYSPWNSPGQNTVVGNLSLLQEIFPIQWSDPGLPHCRQILYQLSHPGSPRTRRDLPKFVCTPRGDRWAQGATAGTKAPVPCGVQLKEGSPLWVPLWSP